MSIEVNQPIEVSKKQYDFIVSNFSGIVFHRKQNDKYFVKVGLKKYIPYIEAILSKIK